MYCGRCGQKIPDEYLKRDAFACPKCGKRYSRKPPNQATGRMSNGAPHTKQANTAATRFAAFPLPVKLLIAAAYLFCLYLIISGAIGILTISPDKPAKTAGQTGAAPAASVKNASDRLSDAQILGFTRELMKENDLLSTELYRYGEWSVNEVQVVKRDSYGRYVVKVSYQYSDGHRFVHDECYIWFRYMKDTDRVVWMKGGSVSKEPLSENFYTAFNWGKNTPNTADNESLNIYLRGAGFEPLRGTWTLRAVIDYYTLCEEGKIPEDAWSDPATDLSIYPSYDLDGYRSTLFISGRYVTDEADETVGKLISKPDGIYEIDLGTDAGVLSFSLHGNDLYFFDHMGELLIYRR